MSRSRSLFDPRAILVAPALLGSVACGRLGYTLEAEARGAGAGGAAVESSGGASPGAAGLGAGGAPPSGGAPGAGGAPPSGGAPGAGGEGGAAGGAAGAGGNAGGADAGTPDGAAGGAPSDSGRDAPADGRPDGNPGCRITLPPTLDYCTEIPALQAAPAIDGSLDCALPLRAVTPLGWAPATAPDSTLTFAVAWAPGGLYFHAEVQDPVVLPAAAADPVWMGDSLEIYVDHDAAFGAAPLFDAEGTRQLIVAAPGVPPGPPRGEIYVQGAGASSSWSSSTFAAVAIPGGYAIEAWVTAADLGLPSWTLEAGARVGLDLGLNVSFQSAAEAGAEGHRLGQYFFRLAPTGLPEPYRNVEAFCTPVLLAP